MLKFSCSPVWFDARLCLIPSCFSWGTPTDLQMAEEIYLSYIPFLVGTAFIIVISSLFLCRRHKSLVRPGKKAKTPYPHKWIDFNEQNNKGEQNYCYHLFWIRTFLQWYKRKKSHWLKISWKQKFFFRCHIQWATFEMFLGLIEK